MATDSTTKPKRVRMGQCTDCGSPVENIADNRHKTDIGKTTRLLCYDCMAGEYVYCEICNMLIYKEMPCRHVRWVEYTYCGCGYYSYDRTAEKASLFHVLDHTGLAQELRTALLRCRYRFFWHWPLLGGGWLEVHLNDGADVGQRFTKGITDANEEAMSLGVNWLVSLEAGKTKGCDALTVSWIDEYLADIAYLNPDNIRGRSSRGKEFAALCRIMRRRCPSADFVVMQGHVCGYRIIVWEHEIQSGCYEHGLWGKFWCAYGGKCKDILQQFSRWIAAGGLAAKWETETPMPKKVNGRKEKS